MCDFLEVEELDEVVLNPGNGQRLFFVAANFRKEVTATVLWLREHQIDARCIKVTPYAFGEELLVDIQPVIPTPEAADFMIGMAEKDAEEKTSQHAKRWSHQMRLAFWEKALKRLSDEGCSEWENAQPTTERYMRTRAPASGTYYALVFLRHEIRVELVLFGDERSANNEIFDSLLERREEIERDIGENADWRKLDGKKRNMIVVRQAVQGYSKENWSEMISWLIGRYGEFRRAFDGQLENFAKR